VRWPELTGTGVRLVVGASRGIGLALTEAQLDDPSVIRVIATERSHSDRSGLDRLSQQHGERLQRLTVDVTDAEGIGCLARELLDVAGGVDVAIHAAGLLHDGELRPERSLADCSPDHLLRLFAVNSVAPLMVARAVLSSQPRRRRFTFAALSAMVGSIADNRLGGWYGYRASKAALNQFIKTLAIECRRQFPEATILAIHPGTTDTALSRPFTANVQPDRLYAPAETAKRILEIVDRAEPAQSGILLNWDGRQIPW